MGVVFVVGVHVKKGNTDMLILLLYMLGSICFFVGSLLSFIKLFSEGK
jgi:hypothetical protein